MAYGLRIFTSARPSQIGAPVLPMEREQERFWQLRRERIAQKETRA